MTQGKTRRKTPGPLGRMRMRVARKAYLNVMLGTNEDGRINHEQYEFAVHTNEHTYSVDFEAKTPGDALTYSNVLLAEAKEHAEDLVQTVFAAELIDYSRPMNESIIMHYRNRHAAAYNCAMCYYPEALKRLRQRKAAYDARQQHRQKRTRGR